MKSAPVAYPRPLDPGRCLLREEEGRRGAWGDLERIQAMRVGTRHSSTPVTPHRCERSTP